MSYDRVVALPDLHVPYHDDRAFATALRFLGVVRPHIVVIIGDWVDFYQLSRFIKDPQRKLELQSDCDTTNLCLRKVRRAAPKAKIVYLRGNHEHRLVKHLWGTESPLAGLRGLRVPELLGFSDLGIEYAETGFKRIGKLLFKHGNVVRSRSGYSATAELEKLWVSGVSGHTHRLGQIYRTNEQGAFTWIESGALCRLDPEYMEGATPDWCHGVTYAEVRSDRFIAHPVPIINGRIVFGGKEIR